MHENWDAEIYELNSKKPNGCIDISNFVDFLDLLRNKYYSLYNECLPIPNNIGYCENDTLNLNWSNIFTMLSIDIRHNDNSYTKFENYHNIYGFIIGNKIKDIPHNLLKHLHNITSEIKMENVLL